MSSKEKEQFGVGIWVPLITDHGTIAACELKRGISIYAKSPEDGSPVVFAKVTSKGRQYTPTDVMMITLQGGYDITLALDQVCYRIIDGKRVATRAEDLAAGDRIWRELEHHSDVIQKAGLVEGTPVVPITVAGDPVALYTESKLLILAGSKK